MRLIPTITIGFFLLVLSGAVIAQEKPTAECPTISVAGPAGVIARPELVTFVAKVEPNHDSLKYLWSVSGGVIVSGQGTPRISVRPDSYAAVQVTASVHITGLPNKCMNIATETAVSVCDPESIFYGIWNLYGDLTWEEERKRLDELVIRGLKEQPGKVAYVEKSFRFDVPWQTREAQILRIKNYVYKTRRIPKNKFAIKQKSLGPSNGTKMQLVPPDAYVLTSYYLEC